MVNKEKRVVSEIYYEDSGRARGKCSVCGTEETHEYQGKGKNKSKTYPKPYYFRVFEKVNWFRGDDVYRGVICKGCIKDGRLAEAHKQTPNPNPQDKEIVI